MPSMPGIKGAVLPQFGYGQPAQASWTSPSSGATGAYGAAVNTNAADYDKIMGRYDTLFNTASESRNKQVSTPQVSAQSRSYQAVPDYQRGGMLSEVADKLSNFSNTGGYSDGDITAFRERGLSPIRSIYASALQNLKRQRSIQGGYSPNYGAMQAKLAREQSGIIGQHTMDLNANIGERVQEGKKFGLSTMAPLAAQETGAINSIRAANAEGVNRTNDANVTDQNRVNELNAQLKLDVDKTNATNSQNSVSQMLAANAGATNAYGTTPAMTQLFGNQVLASNAQNLQGQTAEAQIRQARAGTGAQLVGMNATQRPINYGGPYAGVNLGR